MPNLLLHQGDNRVERSDVKSAHTPSSTRTWQPIAHNKLLETVEDSLSRKGFFITNESHGLSHNGDRYFGLLEIRSGDEHQDYRSVVGVRNSHDKRFPAGVVLGNCVLVCSNLAFSVGNSAYDLLKKAKYNIPEAITNKKKPRPKEGFIMIVNA